MNEIKGNFKVKNLHETVQGQDENLFNDTGRMKSGRESNHEFNEEERERERELFNFTCNDISVIYVTAHIDKCDDTYRCAGGLRRSLTYSRTPNAADIS